jgi:hypothetical protein
LMMDSTSTQLIPNAVQRLLFRVYSYL